MLAAILPAGIAIVLLERIPPAAAALGLCSLLAAIVPIRWHKMPARLGLILLGLAPILMLLPFVWPPGRGFGFSMIGLERGISIALRALSLGVLAQVVVDAAPLHRTLAAARSLGIPEPLVQIVLLVQRYAATITEEIRRLRVAWRARGFVPGTNSHTYRTLALGIGSVLVRSGDRGERVAAAMKARGFHGEFHAPPRPPASTAGIAASIALIAAAAGLLAWDRLA